MGVNMEFKKCEHCGEQIHIRSQKCPFCNQTVEEEPKIEEKSEKMDENKQEILENNSGSDKTEEMQEDSENKEINDVPPTFDFRVGQEPQDYVYKAEVKHSLEYTSTMSNLTKVFLSAICTIPLIGQILGTFLGVFFITYEDSDRKSFGKALIILSITMFLLYAVYVKEAVNLLNSSDFKSIYNSLGQ